MAVGTLPADAPGRVVEYPISWPAGAPGRMAHHGGNGHEGGGVHRTPCNHGGPAPHGSTHELAFDPRTGNLWVSGQNFDALMQMAPDGRILGFAPMPRAAVRTASASIARDGSGRRWNFMAGSFG